MAPIAAARPLASAEIPLPVPFSRHLASASTLAWGERGRDHRATDGQTGSTCGVGQSTHRYGLLWDYIGDADHPGVVFDYTPTHARDGPADFLKDFRGYLQVDTYGGYAGSNGAIIEVACWAHAVRRQ
jgi:hypothetical protein